MKQHIVSIPGTPYGYPVTEAETAATHNRVLRALWLGLTIKAVCKLTKAGRTTVDGVRIRARETLGLAGLETPHWLMPKQGNNNDE